MKHPLITKMPWRTDMRIKMRLLCASARRSPVQSFGMIMVPAFALWLFMVAGGTTPPSSVSPTDFVAAVYAAEARVQEQAKTDIYHVVREISEGKDKSAYVASVMGVATTAEPRIDVVETFQHHDTALARIQSNGRALAYEVFLARQHDTDTVALHHYGSDATVLSSARTVYDAAHDLTSLYEAYTKLDTQTVTGLPRTAVFKDIDTSANRVRFSHVPQEGIRVDIFVDVTTYQIVEEVIYVRTSDREYEMTRIAYKKREFVPAAEFERVFSPTQHTFTVIATKEVS